MGEVGGGFGLSMDDVRALIPQPSVAPPSAEATTPSPGNALTKYVQEGHSHPRLTSVTVGSVTTGNTATVAFTRAFANEPGIDYQELPATGTTTTADPADTNAAAQPTQSKVIAWVKDANGNFTGCTLRVWKSQTVPQNLATLLLGGVFNLFAASVIGTRFSLIAVARSDV